MHVRSYGPQASIVKLKIWVKVSNPNYPQPQKKSNTVARELPRINTKLHTLLKRTTISCWITPVLLVTTPIDDLLRTWSHLTVPAGVKVQHDLMKWRGRRKYTTETKSFPEPDWTVPSVFYRLQHLSILPSMAIQYRAVVQTHLADTLNKMLFHCRAQSHTGRHRGFRKPGQYCFVQPL